MVPVPCVSLNTGAQMPLLGLGTYQLVGAPVVLQAVDAALAAGYRAFDTAAVYGNEADVGGALKELMPKYGLNRQDVFITSKLGPKDQGPGALAGALHSLSELDLDWIDLYLIHWPGTQGLHVSDHRNPENRAQSWSALEQLQLQGKLKAIGVSNYTPDHLRALLRDSTVTPAVLQVEFHPRLPQCELRSLCAEEGVVFQSYSSLGRGQLCSDSVVLKVSEACGRTAAQVLLRWAVQQDIGVLPKSSCPERIRTNASIFDFSLSESHMSELRALGSGGRVCWDPSQVA